MSGTNMLCYLFHIEQYYMLFIPPGTIFYGIYSTRNNIIWYLFHQEQYSILFIPSGTIYYAIFLSEINIVIFFPME
jgi:hypothetical protein